MPLNVIEALSKPEAVQFLLDHGATHEEIARSVQLAINAEMVQRHPELLQSSREDDARNEATVYGIVKENGWDLTVENVEAALAAAKENGQLRLSEAPALPAVAGTQIVSQTAPNFDPASKTILSPPMSEEEFLQTAPTKLVGEYLKKKFPEAPSLAQPSCVVGPNDHIYPG